MTASSTQQITRLLLDWSNGDQAAFDQLMPLVYQELRSMAHRHLRKERVGHTLQTLDLVNEAYIRLVGYNNVFLQERAQFFAIAARVMRHILTDHARTRLREKREGTWQKVALDEGNILLTNGFADYQNLYLNWLALDEAMTRLATFDARKSKVVEMRFFGGMSNEEIATALNIHPNTVKRDWDFAEAWLRRELNI